MAFGDTLSRIGSAPACSTTIHKPPAPNTCATEFQTFSSVLSNALIAFRPFRKYLGPRHHNQASGAKVLAYRSVTPLSPRSPLRSPESRSGEFACLLVGRASFSPYPPMLPLSPVSDCAVRRLHQYPGTVAPTCGSSEHSFDFRAGELPLRGSRGPLALGRSWRLLFCGFSLHGQGHRSGRVMPQS
jgi:hypothetical protein